MKRILLVEDDPAIQLGLIDSLKEEHFDVISAIDGEEGYQRALNEKVDLIILDLLLPSKNGIEICNNLRQKGVQTPILMLTAKKDEVDIVLGLEMGADDYVTKPFKLKELIARVKALLRRKVTSEFDIDSYSFDNISINFKKMEASRNNVPLELSVTEYKILKYFIKYESDVISRHQLLDEVWGYESFPTTRTVDNFILSIRKKIEVDPSNPQHLLTIHKAGYKFVK